MLDEQQAIQVAYQAFREQLPDAAIREVTSFTYDNGLLWMVRFDLEDPVEVNEETGITTIRIISPNFRMLHVNGDTGCVSWPREIHWSETSG